METSLYFTSRYNKDLWKNPSLVPLIIYPIIYILGSLFDLYVLNLFGLICLLIYIITILTRDEVSSKELSTAALIIPLTLILGTTIKSFWLVGTDISQEYQFYLNKVNNIYLEGDFAYRPTLASSILAPYLTKIFHIPGLFIYKWLFPVLYSISFYILYKGYKRFLPDKVAFISLVLLVCTTTTFIEITAIPRQQLAEFFLSIFILGFLTLKSYLKYLTLTILLVLMVLAHYGTSIYVVMGLSVASIYSIIKYKNYYLFILALILGLSWFLFYSNVEDGSLYNAVKAVISARLDDPFRQLWSGSGILKLGLGLDFFQVSTLGKVFRIIQIVIQFIILIGTIKILCSKNIDTRFKLLVLSGLAILAIMIVFPETAIATNATRVYQIALFFISPAFGVGVFYLLNKRLASLIIILYFSFTLGLVFEISSQTQLNYSIPYSIPLSNHRVDLGASITKDDVLLAQWVAKNPLEDLCSDFYGGLVLHAYLGEHDYYWEEPKKELNTNCKYFFYTSRNNKDNLVSKWSTIGLRKSENISIVPKGSLIKKIGTSSINVLIK